MGVLLEQAKQVTEQTGFPFESGGWRPGGGRHRASGEAPGGDLETHRLPRLLFLDGGFHDLDGGPAVR
jgi:hypothetical protein